MSVYFPDQKTTPDEMPLQLYWRQLKKTSPVQPGFQFYIFTCLAYGSSFDPNAKYYTGQYFYLERIVPNKDGYWGIVPNENIKAEDLKFHTMSSPPIIR
jgi:hypothetical protein